MTRERVTAEQPIRNWNDVFTAVSAEPRRQLVVSLSEQPADDPVSLPESATNPAICSDSDTLRRELYHRHLPLLADMAFVEWDTEPLVATRGPRFEEIAVVVDSLHANAGELPESLLEGCHWIR
ncbi:hypothetical protein [Natronorubrum thiooxidans]|uniref:ArsR family transcriptional regulator n=1 Tax=Natronorubrum thiooxidans TaxID=308853 RepID=A0A1N7EGX7_9EURY|nr:hypothetical protein [Natronorubrum thiooxidans]SIR87310.1 hypothetical protein SAMN05421752_10489 [Natronorubrum thiooxidans]